MRRRPQPRTSTTPRLRITGLCLLACLLFSALLLLPLQARADPTPGQTWTDGACKKDAGITLTGDAQLFLAAPGLH